MVAWKDGEPDIEVGFKREFVKGMQDTPKSESRMSVVPELTS
jgi:hypothetical protein